MLIHWIWLCLRSGMNDREKAAIVRRFQDPEDIYYADAEAYAQENQLTAEAVCSLQNKDLSEAEEILRQCSDLKIHLLTYRDAQYPLRLKNIADPPMVLYYKGQLPDFDGLPVIGIVGTRSATAYGLTISKRMGTQIARCGGLVVSGLAVGIDGMAMRGALSVGGAGVVGVMGCGLDIVYPSANRSLLQDTEKNGCLLSEYPPGTMPMKWNFPRRNRIISGLSCGILVVEAPERSGALITARQAADQGRDVFVVPGNVDVAACTGSNALLRDGAIAVGTGWDVLSEYADLFPGKVRMDRRPSVQTISPEEERIVRKEAKVAQKSQIPGKKQISESHQDKKSIDNTAQAPYIDLKKSKQPLTADEQRILELLRKGECLVDEVIADSGLSSGSVLSALTLMEIKGLIVRLPGRRVCLSGQNC